MAAELVGTAYVRIRALTAGLGSDISDGLDKGVRDAGPDIDRSGQEVGDRLGDGTKEGFGDSLGDGKMGDSVTDALDAPGVHRDVERTGGKYSTDTKRGFDKESKRKNPFSSLLDSLDNIGKAIPTGGAKIWGSLFSPQIVQAFAPAISSLLAGTISAIGVLATSAAGAGVALGGAFGLAIPAAGVLLAALKADTEELAAFKEEAKGLLAPWRQVAVATQRTLLPGLTAALRNMQQLVPLFTVFGEQIGDIAGRYAEFASGILTSERNVDALSDILDRSTGFFENMGAAALALLDSFLPLLQSAAPIAEQLAISLRGMAEHFRDFVVAGNESGSLRATFQNWYENLQQVARIVGNLASALWDVLQIGSDSGRGLLDRIEEVTQKWADFTNSIEGQNAIKKWFDDAKPVLSELWGLLGDIAEIFVKPLVFGGVEGTDGTVEFIRTIRRDWIPTFKRLSDSLSGQGLGDALKRLADAFIEVIDKLSGSGTLASSVSTLAFALEIMADALSNPVFQTVFPYIFATAGALKALSLVTGPILSLAKVLPILAEGLALIGGGSVVAGLATFGLVIAAIAVAVGSFVLVWKNFDTITDAIKSVWEWLSDLNPVLRTFLIIMGGFFVLANPITVAAAALYGLVAAIKNFDSVIAAFQTAWEAVVGFVTGLPELLTELPGLFAELGGAIVDGLSNLPQLLGGIGTAILDFFAGLPDQIGAFIEDLPDLIGGALRDGVSKIPDLLLDALGGLGTIGEQILSLLADGLQAGLPRIAEFFAALPGNILRFIGNVASTLLPIGVQILAFLAQGLAKGLPQVLAFFATLPIKIATLVRKGIQALIEIGIQMLLGLIEGLQSALPRVGEWFKALPGNLLRFNAAAITWLVETGVAILQGLLSGLQSTIGVIASWFIALPGNIVTWVSSAVPFMVSLGATLMQGILDGIISVAGALNEFFAGLPQAALSAMGDFFTFLWENLAAGAAGFLSNLIGWGAEIMTELASLPGRALTAIGDLGMTIWNAVSGGFATALSNIQTWVTDGLGKLATFASEVPGKVASIVTSLPGKIGEATAAALTTISTWVTDGLNKLAEFGTGVPGKLASFGSNLASELATAFTQALSDIRQWVTDALAAVGKFATQLPGKLAGMAGDMAAAVGNALRSAWNSAVSKLPSISVPLPFGLGFDINPGSILRLAMGAVVPGTWQGTLALIAEGGRSEAVVPLERPSRALAVMQEAGLDKLVLQAYLGGIKPGTPGTTGGDVTMLNIEHATIQSQTDADLLVQSAAAQYRRMTA